MTSVIDLVAQAAVIVAAAGVGAYVLANVTVEFLQLFGMVWTAAREQERHREDGHGDGLEHVKVVYFTNAEVVIDAAVRRAIAAPARRTTPLADRRAMIRVTRLVQVTGGEPR